MKHIKPVRRHILSARAVLVLGVLIIGSFFLFSIVYKGDPLPPVVTASLNKELIISPESGYHVFPVRVKVENYTPGTVYTIDGSTPGLESNFYTTPLYFKRPVAPGKLSYIPTSPRWFPPLEDSERIATLFRASNLTANAKLANPVSRLFLQSAYRSELPIVSITVNENDLFSQQTGIYVLGERYEDKRYYIRHMLPLDSKWWDYPANYTNRGADSERPGQVEYIANGKSILTSHIGLRIRGNATRAFAQKSLTIDLGVPRQFSFFNDSARLTHSFVLRNGGNDWTKTMFRDELMQTLMTGFDLEIQRYQPVIVYINGEYWGIHNLRDHVDNEYLALKYSVPKDSVTILEMPVTLKDGNEASLNSFSQLLSEVRVKGCSDTSVFRKVNEQIDLENLTDFVIANIYFANSDWPANNCRFWRPDSGSTSGKWKWILFDTDYGFGYTGPNSIETDMFQKALYTSDMGVLMRGLFENDAYRDFFTERFRFHLKSTFKPERVIALINRFEHQLEDEMPHHLDRWRTLSSVDSWKREVNILRTFAQRRSEVVSRQLEKYSQKKFKL